MNNNFLNMFGGAMNFQQQFNQFAQQFRQSGQIPPQQIVQNMLNSGQMTQEQFNQLRAIANQITGKNY